MWPVAHLFFAAEEIQVAFSKFNALLNRVLVYFSQRVWYGYSYPQHQKRISIHSQQGRVICRASCCHSGPDSFPGEIQPVCFAMAEGSRGRTGRGLDGRQWRGISVLFFPGLLQWFLTCLPQTIEMTYAT